MPLINEEMFHGKDICDLMGNRIFGAYSWSVFFRIRMWESALPMVTTDLKNLLKRRCPFIKNKQIKDTHFLFLAPTDRYGRVLIPRVSITDTEDVLNGFHPLEKCRGFFDQRISVRWHLFPINGVRIDAPPFYKQCNRINKNYRLAHESEEVLKMVLFKLRVAKDKKFSFVHTVDCRNIEPHGGVDFNNLKDSNHYKIGTRDNMIISEIVPHNEKFLSLLPLKRII
jgi:hypothetical protein